ncbi:MerR family transcriptional regulator [Sporolactobacillus nakayamae]|uniref:MerR HTH family regulatory protein n=1 Tax=Sporolactobacillus nakayamae TaxID=269670 RepID=A0A1I2MPK9_9BACL|nr:MerR family transcriptional regulator [Sporolactobacillus nakayamae]SFF93382.1 MerR HTH family regulatory protein [Sporolactobacillus nakayamae]
MKIGEFVKRCQTTKDTIRYYEELALIKPDTSTAYKDYNQKNINDFQVIKEMQSLGLSLRVIQGLFKVKRMNGCGSQSLIHDVTNALNKQEDLLRKEEKRIRDQRMHLRTLIVELQSLNKE